MRTLVNGLLALLVLVGGVVGLALGARAGLSWLFEGVNPTVSAAIVAATATTLVSVLGVTLGRYLERRHQIDLELRERKIPIYTEFVEGILSVFASANESDDEQPKRGRAKGKSQGSVNAATTPDNSGLDMMEFLTRMTPKLTISASNDVVVKWSKFRRGADKHPPIEYMFMMEDLMTAIRKDLGHSGGDIAKGDLLGLYINDIDQHLPATKTKSSGEGP